MRLSIGSLFAVTLGLMLALVTGGTIAMLAAVAGSSTRQLLSDKGRLTRDRTVQRIRGEMDRVEELTKILVAELDAAERPLDAERFAAEARRVLTAAPSASGAICRGEERCLRFDRDSGRCLADEAACGDLAARAAAWLPARELAAGGPLVLPFVMPFEEGTAAILLDLDHVSRSLAEVVGADRQTSFLLDGPRRILAHSSADRIRPGTPLDPDGADPVPALIDNPSRERHDMRHLPHAFLDRTDGHMYSVFYEPLTVAGGLPLVAGAYYRSSDLGAPGDTIFMALAAATGMLLACMAGAVLIGRQIGRPIRELASVAKRMETLTLQDTPPLPRSRVTEIDNANQAINAAIGGLGAFARYVPRDLVLRLLRANAGGATESTNREVTILFTDIAGYTAAAGKMSAADTARFLNQHFELLNRCVEEHGGTVDKFIGDSLMAFWGAPEPMPDHARRATRACREMATRFLEDPVMRASGVRLRIGLHSGEVVVGNIGAQSRTSYTVIGDPVNVAARLEQVGKEIDAIATVIALTSAETNDRLDAAERGTPVGSIRLRGREAETEIFRLV